MAGAYGFPTAWDAASCQAFFSHVTAKLGYRSLSVPATRACLVRSSKYGVSCAHSETWSSRLPGLPLDGQGRDADQSSPVVGHVRCTLLHCPATSLTCSRQLSIARAAKPIKDTIFRSIPCMDAPRHQEPTAAGQARPMHLFTNRRNSPPGIAPPSLGKEATSDYGEMFSLHISPAPTLIFRPGSTDRPVLPLVHDATVSI